MRNKHRDWCSTVRPMVHGEIAERGPCNCGVTNNDLFTQSILDWYLLTSKEWDRLSADAQHRLIDRFMDSINVVTFEGVWLDPEAMLEEHITNYGLQAQRHWLDGKRRPDTAPDYLPL